MNPKKESITLHRSVLKHKVGITWMEYTKNIDYYGHGSLVTARSDGNHRVWRELLLQTGMSFTELEGFLNKWDWKNVKKARVPAD
jgi:hypothetical protein